MQLHSCPVCMWVQFCKMTTYRNTLQHTEDTATNCNTLQHTATHCNQPVLRVCRCILTGVLYLCGRNYARCSVFVRRSCIFVHTRHSLQFASVFMRRCCIFVHRIHSLHVKDSILLSRLYVCIHVCAHVCMYACMHAYMQVCVYHVSRIRARNITT